jgi:hypothetical protein
MRYLNGKAERKAAMIYFQDQLATGKALSRFLLQNVQLSEGALACLAPTTLDPSQIVQFDTGRAVDNSTSHKLIIGEISGTAYPKPRSDLPLSEFLHTRLTDAKRVLLLENALAESTDPWLSGAKSRIFFYQNEVYHAVFYSDRLQENIVNAVREAENSANFVGVVGVLPAAALLASPAASLSSVQLETLARSAQCIFVAAYDGEGYLIWEKMDGGQVTRR